MTIQQSWQPIEKKIKEIAPSIFESLQDGVTAEQITTLETELGVKLPDDFIAFYQVHNGQDDYASGFVDSEELLSFERILDEWKVWKDLYDSKILVEDDGTPFPSEPTDEKIKPDLWWNPLWIPFTYDGGGNHFCLDLDPTNEGQIGQVIRMWHDDAERTLEAASFLAWVENYKDKLLSGQYVYNEEYEGIVDKDSD